MPELSVVWFVLLGALFTGYALLDGFDLGAGAVHLIVARNDGERRNVLNAIGPVWDGNEVWLITAGGVLFAAFPLVYGTALSGFYLAVVLLLGSLILRGVSIEFRGKETNQLWRQSWDVLFSVGSTLAAVLFGVALGNVMRGIPIGADGVYRGGFVGLLNPFSLMVGVLTLGIAVQQGTSWLVLKTEGPLADRARRIQLVAIAVVAVAWVGSTLIALVDAKRVFDNFYTPIAWVGPVVVFHSLAFLLRSNLRRQPANAFLCSCLAIIGLAITAGTALYPNLLPSTGAGASLTASSAHSSNLTMSVMLVIAAIGMPIVLAYTAYIYRKFKGKVQLDEASY
jgi:cytochrome d ubiquinol oxidase subunit II